MFELLKITGKELFACQSAVRDFSDILKTVGGEKEQERARYVVLGSVYTCHVHCKFIEDVSKYSKKTSHKPAMDSVTLSETAEILSAKQRRENASVHH